MINKSKYAVLILSANIFLCSAEKKCKFLDLLTTTKQDEIKNTDTNIEIPEILQDTIKETQKKETKLDKDKGSKEVTTLKRLLDCGLKQKASENAKESVEGITKQNLEIIETLIKSFESSKLPKILKKIVNTENLIKTYKEDETFQKISCVEQIKLILMFWCLRSQIEFDFQNETIEQFTQKITYSNIKKILNGKIDELINEEKNTKEGTSEGNIPEEDSKNWESYKIFKIDEKEKIKDLFYSFIKQCILTSIAILIHKYCALCKDKFGDVFIGEDIKKKYKEYTYKTTTSYIFNSSDEGDTIAKTQNLFSSNDKYKRICNISFEDITTLIEILTKLPDYSDFIKQCNNESNMEVNEINVSAFKNYKKLLDFITQKKNEEIWNENKFDDSVHFYDIMKFFDMKIKINNINGKKEKNDETEDLEIVYAKTFGDLVDKVNINIENNLRNIKNITFEEKKSKKHVLLNLSFNNCRFTNPSIDITNLIAEEESDKDDDIDDESDNESY